MIAIARIEEVKLGDRNTIFVFPDDRPITVRFDDRDVEYNEETGDFTITEKIKCTPEQIEEIIKMTEKLLSESEGD